MKSNLAVLLEKSAKERPGKLAPILGDRVLDYTGLPDEVKKFANALTALGEKPLPWST
jgi:non-ribosomal peptide synthetase component E (peptide arylation enzyme)